MKRSLGLLSVLVLAIGCGGGNTKDATAPTATVQPTAAPTATAEAPPEPDVPALDAQKAYVKDGDAAWAAHDAKKFMALYAGGAVIAEPGPQGWTEKKPADMERELTAFFAAFPDVKLTTTRLITQGQMAVVEWTLNGTHQGEFMGAKATNKPIGYRGASLLVFDKKGKIEREHLYQDHATMMGQLGLGPKGPKFRAVEPAPTTPLEIVSAKDGEGAPNVELLKKLYEAGEKKDTKAYGALLANDFVLSNSYDPADQKRFVLLQQQPIMNRAFPDPKWAVKNCVSTVDLAACEIEWTATWTAPAMGMKATGKTGTVHALEVAQVKEGKLVRLAGYGSGAEFAYAFGIATEPPKPATAEPAKDTLKDAPKDAPKDAAKIPPTDKPKG